MVLLSSSDEEQCDYFASAMCQFGLLSDEQYDLFIDTTRVLRDLRSLKMERFKTTVQYIGK